MAKYTHTIEVHNLESPREIVPIICSLFEIKSVVDIGCGLGTFLRAFKECGINDILGIDGKWCNKKLLYENIPQENFLELDLEKAITLNRKFDLLVSVEVAEHLSPNRAKSFVEDIAKLSDVILFSAAIPFQGGDHHYNEQWLPYWNQKFGEQGFELFDVLKPLIWENPRIFWWYKQNMVLFVKKGTQLPKLNALSKNELSRVVHPELFETYANPKSPNSLKRYIKMLLMAMKS
jgi:SAM-dependent methyltransferase